MVGEGRFNRGVKIREGLDIFSVGWVELSEAERASRLLNGSGYQGAKVGAIAGFAEAFDLCFEAGAIEPALAVGDFFEAGDFEALAIFYDGNELSGVEQAVVCAGIEPGGAATEEFDAKVAAFEVTAV
jgi:hypothetical protein